MAATEKLVRYAHRTQEKDNTTPRGATQASTKVGAEAEGMRRKHELEGFLGGSSGRKG